MEIQIIFEEDIPQIQVTEEDSIRIISHTDSLENESEEVKELASNIWNINS